MPLFLDVAGRSVLVVGAGAVAARRTARLLDAGARVTVVAPERSDAIDPARVEVVRRRFAPDDVIGHSLVLACTDDPEVNSAVAAAAEAQGIWCGRADNAAESAVWFPAVAQVDDVTVAVGGSGDPGRATTMRDQLELLLRGGELTSRRSRAREGRVVLVGGGPGDPDLLTLKGYRALLDADVVVTDRLGPTDLLARLPSEIEVLDVGKIPRASAPSQQRINDLLIERARAGQVVVRLKGGDPFVLGRGSEEVEACAAAGVRVDVIPGLSSATAAATLAGVPLTERGVTQQFSVVSGHVPPGDPRSTVDWAALASTDATLVLLMAVANLPAIEQALLAGGRDGQTPCAIVENASLSSQRIIGARLDRLATVAQAHAVVPPAVVVIGEVAGGISPADGADAPPT